MLLRFDPYLDVDRLAEHLLGLPLPARRIPMDALRRGDHVELRCDLPGVDPESVAISVSDHVLTVRATRRAPEQEGDQALELECTQGLVARDVLLGDDLDAPHLEHDFRDGVLVVRIPVVNRRAVARFEG
ncbi:MAG: Hsp20/alpha crystallin family protein [Acidimicrobiia bacterium]